MTGERVRYGLALGFLVAAAATQYLVPLVPQAVIDGVLVEGGERASDFTRGVVDRMGGAEFVRDHLWVPALAMVLVTAAAGLFAHLRTRLSARASEAIAKRLRDRMYDHIQRLPCRTLDERESGDLLQRATSDVETLRTFLSNQVIEIGRALLMLVAPLPVMLALDWRMALASTALVPFIVGFSVLFFRRMRPIFLKKEEAEGRMTTTITENLTGIRVVRAFARQEFEKEKFAARSNAYREEDLRLYRLMARFWSTSDLLCFGQQLIVVGFGLHLLIRGELEVGAFYYFITAVMMFIWPVRMMGRILAELGKAIVAIGRIREILDLPEERATDAAPVAPLSAPPSRGAAIEFRDVRFSHRDARVLDHVTFSIGAGQTLGLVGPSGAGKTTIVQLLLRLYEYESGSILVDGRELNTIPRSEIRGMIATVLQQPFLYSKTLRDNILISAAGHMNDEEAMHSAAGLASVHESIESFPQRYDTLVGERGITLSGGQRQRVAIARSLVQDPRVLILDDALSAVDTRTESDILGAFRRRDGGHTTIIVAHRLSTLMHADRIVVLDRGRVVQTGRHEELLAQPGLYRTLWRIQTSIEEDESSLEEERA